MKFKYNERTSNIQTDIKLQHGLLKSVKDIRPKTALYEGQELHH